MRKVIFVLFMCTYAVTINAQGSYWNLTGNVSTTPGTNFIGTTDAQRLVIKTDNTEQVTVLTNGNLGIGTASPAEKLHVIGNGIVSGYLSSPGSGSGTEKYGAGSSVGTTNYSYAAGFAATATGNQSVAIGYLAQANYLSVAIGSSASATGAASTVVGTGASDNGANYVTAIGASISNPVYFSGGSYLNSGMINIGYNNSSAGHSLTYLIGANLSTDRSNQMLIGNGLAGGFLTDIVLGGGLSNSLAGSYGPMVMRTTDGNGTNAPGMSFTFKGGKSTGSADGGSLAFYTTPAGTSGSSLNTEQERMRIAANGAVSFNGSTGTSGQVLTSAGSGGAPAWTTPTSITATAWGLNGNGSTTPGTNFIGTTDAQRLVIKTGNTEQATILTNGNVGINTASPEQKLDVNGVLQVRRTVDASALATLRNSNALQLQSAYWNGTASVNSNWKITGEQTGTSGPNSSLVIRQDDGVARMSIDYTGWYLYNASSGLVMRHDDASGRLTVAAAIWANSLNAGTVGTYSVGGSAWYDSKIILDNPAVTYYATGDLGDNLTAHRFTVKFPMTGTSSLLASWDNGGSTLVSIGKTGNLGIGTTAATEKLHVDGNMYTTGKILVNQANTAAVAPYALAVNGTAIFTKAVVKLNANWPDYVFEDDYTLTPLNDLEQYVRKHKHLPGVAAATDIQNNGIDLGDNQTVLLKKVEELTLYLIEINKKVEILTKENEALKKQPNSNN